MKILQLMMSLITLIGIFVFGKREGKLPFLNDREIVAMNPNIDGYPLNRDRLDLAHKKPISRCFNNVVGNRVFNLQSSRDRFLLDLSMVTLNRSRNYYLHDHIFARPGADLLDTCDIQYLGNPVCTNCCKTKYTGKIIRTKVHKISGMRTCSFLYKVYNPLTKDYMIVSDRRFGVKHD